MGIFFEKPSKVPDVTGGSVSPIRDRAKCWNRSGHTISNGMVVQLALTPGEATEAASNDANTYIPGASNDTVWNTIIDPISSVGVGSSIQRGGIWAVCIDPVPIADNAIGEFCLFGLCNAFVARTNTTATEPGSPLVVYASNAAGRINTFDPQCAISHTVVATLLATSNAALTTKRLKKVFLHQGLFAPHTPPAELS
jgi:hypothetical protein